MFKLLKNIKVRSFGVSGDKLLSIRDKKITLYQNDKIIFENNVEGDYTTIFKLQNDSFLIRKDDNTSLKLENKQETYSLFSFMDNEPVDEIAERGDYVLSTKYISYYPVELITELKKTADKTVVFSSTLSAHYSMIKDVLIVIEHKKLTAYKLENGSLKCQFDLAPYFIGYTTTDQSKLEDKIQNYIGLIGNVLWIGLSSGRLLAIDVENGSLVYQLGFKESDFPNFPYEIKEGDYLPFGELMQLDEDKGEIIGLRDKYFMKVDLDQSEPRRKYIDVGQSMAAHKISSSYRNYSFPIDEQFIYFCDDRQGKIGVFDREKKEVIWSYELDMERDGIVQILEMKYANNRWYVLDRNDTLHIFERIL
ncbi:MAG TPA: hypothetical protein VIK89_13580 [Cytophagaceae bacterium]